MNIDDIRRKVLAAARALPPSDHVPYGFERRIMAALAPASGPDVWALWSRLLWRAAAPCVGIMLVVGIWSAVASRSTSTTGTLATDLDRTVWGPLVALNDSW